MNRPAALAACLLLPACLGLSGCEAPVVPLAQVSGLVIDRELDEISGMAASRRHPGVLWMVDDGGNPARLFAVSTRGRRLATFEVDGVVKTDWEDLAAFELEGKAYLLVADTGDNGGLRRSLQLHVFAEPATLDARAPLRPAWSIAFQWPDGARDCEAVAVDAARGDILLVSKKRQPPELFTLPLRPSGGGLQLAERVGTLAGVPSADPADRGHARARVRHQVTAADLSPDGTALAVLTYGDLLLYRRHAGQAWGAVVAQLPASRVLPWLPQAEALAWSADGRGLHVTGEISPAPLLFLEPPGDAPSAQATAPDA